MAIIKTSRLRLCLTYQQIFTYNPPVVQTVDQFNEMLDYIAHSFLSPKHIVAMMGAVGKNLFFELL